jgi:iron complex transport system substrate-binding protein
LLNYFSKKKGITLKINSSLKISLACLLIVFTISAIFSGCGNKQSSIQDKIAVEDMAGKSVMIPKAKSLNKVAVLTSPQDLAVYVIGVQDKLCGVTNDIKKSDLLNRFEPYIKVVPAVRSQVGQVNIEALIQADPDIVIGSESDIAPVEKGSKLTTLRINRAPGKGSISQIKDEVRFFGRVFDKQEKAEQYVSYLDNILSLIKFSITDIPADKRPKVFMGFNVDHLATYGSDTFIDECIKAAGCVNAAGAISGLNGKEGGLVTVTMEQVLSWDPDIVIIDNGSLDNLLSDPSWSKLKAFQNKKVYRLPSGLYAWNKESCEGAALLPQWLAVMAYPDKLNFLNLDNQVTEFYTKNFQIRFPDEVIHNILYPSSGPK